MRIKLPVLLALALAAPVPALAQLAPGLAQAAPVLRTAPLRVRAPDVGVPGVRLRGTLGADVLAEARALVRAHPAVLDLDAAGAVVVRSEVVAIDPSPASLARARAIGFDVAAERVLEGLDLRIVVLRAAPDIGTRQALERLRQTDPDGEYDYNHVYRGAAAPPVAAVGAFASAVARSAAADAPPDQRTVRIGLVDGGVAVAHPGLGAAAGIQTWGCDGKAMPDAHGTAVASLLLTGDDAQAAATELYAADIYCGQPVGGTVTGFADAMAWLARAQVGVVNLSLVGPHNALLQRVVGALAERGHVLVAAVGNDGPAAPPLFPAAYPEVIAVTAVDGRGRVLPEAGRGGHVDFAARGHDLRAARPEADWAPVRGTSFAAPAVARLAARLAPRPAPGNDARVRARLQAGARDLGKRGRDDTYGHGLLGETR